MSSVLLLILSILLIVNIMEIMEFIRMRVNVVGILWY